MDDKIGDLPSGDVHVRDGAIVAVAANVNAPGVQVIAGKGMICMPGFVDTHWHHWTSFLRPLMRADDPKLHLFSGDLRPAACVYTPEDSYRSVRLGTMPRRSPPASPPRRTGRTMCAARRMPTPR